MVKTFYPSESTESINVGELIFSAFSRRRRRLESGAPANAAFDAIYPEFMVSTKTYDPHTQSHVHDFHTAEHRRRLTGALVTSAGIFNLGGVEASDKPGSTASGTPYVQGTLPLTPSSCTKSDTSAISGAACKCASSATTNECAVGNYCWQDSTCKTAANTGGTSTTACTKSDTSAIAVACKCASSATTNECDVGEYCWVDNTCNAAAKSGGAPTFAPTFDPSQYGTIVATVRLKGASLEVMDDDTDALRRTFVDKLAEYARKLVDQSTASSRAAVKVEVLTVIAVASQTRRLASTRRRLLTTGSIDVKFAVGAVGVSDADLAAHVATYMSDTGSEGMASDLSQGGTSIEAETVSAPAAAAAPDAATAATRDDTMLFVGIGAGAALAALVGIALAAVIVALVITAAHGTTAEVELGAIEKSPDTDVQSRAVVTTSNPLRAATHTKEVSRSTGRTYYVDEATLESTWDHPGEHAVVADVTAALVTMSANPMACERDAAPSPEKRVATDGISYTKAEFIAHYGGTTEWGDAHAI
jgi:hypothetical protein